MNFITESYTILIFLVGIFFVYHLYLYLIITSYFLIYLTFLKNYRLLIADIFYNFLNSLF